LEVSQPTAISYEMVVLTAKFPNTGFTVVFFIAGLVSTFHYHLILTSTAFIGATAFILGVDCFTRAGLKEFYIYNLGFRNGLFPKLWVQEEGSVGEWVFPLLTIMQVEIGVLIAVFLVSLNWGSTSRFAMIEWLGISADRNGHSIPNPGNASSQDGADQARGC
jgi:hypothetical protein